MFDLLVAIVLGVVEGVTEFLPVSSTGHLVLCERLFHIDLEHDPFWKMFTVFIQIGAIASVVVYFRQRITDLIFGRRTAALTRLEVAAAGAVSVAAGSAHSQFDDRTPPRESLPTRANRSHAVGMIVIGSLPLVIAYFANKWAERNLASDAVIAAALGAGGLIMIVVELLRPTVTTHQIESMTWRQALGIGLAQIIAAIFPGTSRSAATIVGGEVAGLSRPAAAEFSFFLAIPAMAAACAFSLLKHRAALDLRHALLLAVGTVVSFIVALGVIAAFMAFIRRHSFIPFAVYRIVLAGVVLWVVLKR
jgi:undecaprenyl-diphosphatase